MVLLLFSCKKKKIFFFFHQIFFFCMKFFSLQWFAIGQKNCFHETQMRDFQQIIWVNSNNLGYSFSLNGRKYTWEFSFERWAVMMLSYTWSCCSLLQALTVIGTLSEFVIFNASLSITEEQCLGPVPSREMWTWCNVECFQRNMQITRSYKFTCTLFRDLLDALGAFEAQRWNLSFNHLSAASNHPYEGIHRASQLRVDTINWVQCQVLMWNLLVS